MAIGRGVRIRKRSSGGVMSSRFAASAKKANTRPGGSGKSIEVLRTWSAKPIIVVDLVLRLRCLSLPIQQTISSDGWERTVTDVIENEYWRVADRAADYLSADRKVCRRALHRETEECVREAVRWILPSTIFRTGPYSSATRQHRAAFLPAKGLASL